MKASTCANIAGTPTSPHPTPDVLPVWLRSAADEDAAWAAVAGELGLTLAQFDAWSCATREEKRAAAERVTP